MPSLRCLFHAATSIFIILTLIPSLEAVICQTGGTCGIREATSKTYTPVNCDKSCFSFVCMNNGKKMKGFGCEADLRAVCPDFPDERIDELHGFNNFGFAYNYTYHVFRCASDGCVDALKSGTLRKVLYESTLKLIDELEQKYKLPVWPKRCRYLKYNTTTTSSPLTTSSTTPKPKTTTEKTTPKAVTTTTEATTVKILPTTTNVAETTIPYGEASTTDINDPATNGKTGNSTEEEYYDYGEEEVEVKNDGNQFGVSKVIVSILGAWIFALFL